MGDEPTAPRTRAPRYSPEREAELFTATLDLLRETGYEAFTVDAVAGRTRTSKATLYRRWRGKQDLVIAALRFHKPVTLHDIDTGSLREDMFEAGRRIAAAAGQDTELHASLAHAVARNDELATAFREEVMEPETAALDGILRRAIERGELDAGRPAIAFCTATLFGALASRPAVDGVLADEKYVLEYLEAVLLPALGVA